MGADKAVKISPHGDDGARVVARGWTWTRLGGVGHGAVRRVRVAAASPDAPDLDTLLEPFDRLHPLGSPRGARKVSTGWLRHWVVAWRSMAWPATPVSAPIDQPVALLAHQLSPVLAVMRGASTRVLLADAVGQGKTIEAGVLLRELSARGAADRVLILTPLALRDQWQSELAVRCHLDVDLIDRAALRARDRQTPSGLNPFQAPGIVLLSIDLAKQPDVLARLTHHCWDVLVIDEAHGVSGDSARAAAAAALGARARIVVLLTATPHAGDAVAFARLCAIGRLDGEPPPLWFRGRPLPGVTNRATKTRDISPRRSDDERACAAALGAYVRRLERAGTPAAFLIGLVLRKRLLSSPAALAASLRHRLTCLERTDPPTGQSSLPFDDEETEAGDAEQPAVLGEAGLADPRTEAVLLTAAYKAAERAAAAWSKASALKRLLRSTREQVLVFSEYRDTLLPLSMALSDQTSVVTLHGGSSPATRTTTLAQFADRRARVLMATDVAAEGLNLQHTCRLVVHVELPWSPARLEQRNGRVDRLGQRRRVHVWRLLGDPRHEARIIAALSARLARMRAAGFDVGGLGATLAALAHHPNDLDPRAIAGDDDAERIVEDLARLRRLIAACGRPQTAQPTAGTRSALPWRRVRRWPGGLPPGVTVVCLLPASARGARPVLLPFHVTLSQRPSGSPSRWLPAIARSAVAAANADARTSPLTDALVARERRLLERAEAEQLRVGGRWQGSLFERRAARVVEAARAGAAGRTAEHQGRLGELDCDAVAGAVAVLALLVD